jgi:hypothetical protein
MVNDPYAVFDGVLNGLIFSIELSISKMERIKNNNLLIDSRIASSPLFNCSGGFLMCAPRQ